MKFEEALLEAIDEGLTLLGESPKETLYYHLAQTFNINKRDIPSKIEEFTEAIERIFGNGAKIIEIQIMKCLFEKLDHKLKYYPKQIDLTFPEYIAAVKLEKKGNKNSTEKQSSLKRQRDCNRANRLNRPKTPNRLSEGFPRTIIA
jgi:hypothetical protein